MLGGYAGKLLFVNLSTGEMKTEAPDEKFYRDYIGGYGVGARILYSRQKAGVDALGPDNHLGFVPGPLTGTQVPTGARYMVVTKSPLTGTWGDANSGGEFGPHMKFSGFDGVFFTGKSDKPVYLLMDNGKAELKDARQIWGKDTYATEEIMEAEYGKDCSVACIGQSGEKLSLISCIINKKGCAAGRSGVGAVMGSKKLKAIVARGNTPVPVSNPDALTAVRKDYMDMLMKAESHGRRVMDIFHNYGTSNHAKLSAENGDSPTKNWGGITVRDFPGVVGIAKELVVANLDKHVGCWHCPIRCEGAMKEGNGEYKYAAGTRRPEYETLASFGSLLLNGHTESIIMANHLCNFYGIDTISAGGAVAFAIECYENGILTKKDTDGLELTWGNHKSIISLTEKIAKREGFGDILADGVKVASEKIGKGSDKYAVHCGGQEPGMHDPKLMPPMVGDMNSAAARYFMDATPGRHTQAFGPTALARHTNSSAGLCHFGRTVAFLPRFMSAVTGWDVTQEELLKTGDRIGTIRHAFNLREGINPMKWYVHPRIIGDPPFTEGPLAGVTCDIDAQKYWNLGALDWDRNTTVPSRQKLMKLGLEDIIKDLGVEEPRHGA